MLYQKNLFSYYILCYSSIPRISAERGAQLAQAERFEEAQWNGAAVLRRFSNPSSALGVIAEPTEFYLFHDGEALYADTVSMHLLPKALRLIVPAGVGRGIDNPPLIL